MYLVDYDTTMDAELKGAYISHLTSFVSTNIEYFECSGLSLRDVLNTSQDTYNLSNDDKDFIITGVKEYLIIQYSIELVSDNPIALIEKTIIIED